MVIFIFVVGVLCVNFVNCESTYKAAVVTLNGEQIEYSNLIQEAGKLNADILVLPSSKTYIEGTSTDLEDYDKITKSISASAKRASVYVVAPVFEKAVCQNKEEAIRTNLIFDRRGAVVAAYRKPVNASPNCTSPFSKAFTTDFGVTFGLMMEEDLVLHDLEQLTLKNYLVAGGSKTDIPFLIESQFASSWAFVTNANVLTASAVFMGKAGFRNVSSGEGYVDISVIDKEGGIANADYASKPILDFPVADMSQHTIKPLDMLVTVKGHSESVCHGEFCCNFYVKTSSAGSAQHEVSYGLAAFNGIRHLTGSHQIGVQSCSVVACAGLYKQSCTLGPNKSTNTHFNKITVTGNFSTKKSAQFPLIITSNPQSINFSNENTETTINIENGSNLFSFGIFGRIYGKDNESKMEHSNEYGNCYDYFFNEDVQEFFDYLWIRFRILFFIVSIYVLEMM